MARARRKNRRVEPEPTQESAEFTVRVPKPQGDPYAAYADKEWSFAPAPGAPVGTVSEPGLRALMGEWRRGRATRTLGQVISDTYIAILSVVMIGAMAVNVIINSQGASAACDTAACLTGRSLVPWGMYAALSALALSVSRIVGPVLASAAEGFWLLLAPVRRSPFLRGRLWAAIGIAWGVAAMAMAAVTGVAGASLPAVVGWAIAAGFSASAAVAFAALEQSRDRDRGVRTAQLIVEATAAAVFGLMVAVAGGWVAFVVPPALAAAPWLLAALGLVGTLVWGLAAAGRLEEFHSLKLTSGGSLVSGLQGAMFGLDLGLMRDILVDRKAIERGHVRPTRGRGLGLTAVVWRDAQRLIRFPQPLLGVAAAVLAPYACEAVGLSSMAPWLSAIALMLALVPTLGALRVLSRTRGLARTFPFSTGQLRMASFVVPGVLAFGWALLAAPAFAGLVGGTPRDALHASGIAVACGAAGLLGAVRWQTAKPVDFGVPMMATAAGAMPPTLVFNLLRGFDVATLITVPILLNLDPMWSLGLALVVGLVLGAGMNTDELQDQAKAQRQELDAERAKRRN